MTCYTFKMPVMETFRAFVNAESEEEAWQKLKEEDWEDGDQRDPEFFIAFAFLESISEDEE